MKSWYFIIDVAKCENCKNCFVSCKDEHVGNDWPPYAASMPSRGQSWIDPASVERGSYPFIDVAYLPNPCMHCDDAPCMRVVTGAVYKRADGIVLIDPAKARGREEIVAACPYQAIHWNGEQELPQKCTFCVHLLDQGWKQTRCTQSCPTGALTVRLIDDSALKQLIADEGLEVYHPERKTNPRVYYKNLYRFTRCFIAGTGAVTIDGKAECAQGATVTLTKGTEKIATCTTDNYGDFKFDNLEPNSGAYRIEIIYPDRQAKQLEVEVTKSVSAGTVWL